MILVKKDEQRMWVKNPKKIKFWKAIANQSKNHPLGFPVKILKEVND